MTDKKKILVSEDNPDLRKILMMRLEVNGYDVIEAVDGEQALSKVRSERPDLILLDLMMPKLTGFEVVRMLRFEEEFENLPVIVLSALDQQKEREKAIEAGADAYFIKPFELDLLLIKIRSLTGEV